MLSTRQEELLKLITEEYIRTVKPVSSIALCEVLNCSSATIRNEMMVLEELGLLEKTHTSSGRVPSEQGYRYYVDKIIKTDSFLEDDFRKIENIFNNNSLMITDAITKSMELVAELTNYASLVLGSSSYENKITKLEVVPINDNSIIAIIITDHGFVEHKQVNLEKSVSPLEIKTVVELINRLLLGTPLHLVLEKLEYEIKPLIGQYVKQHEVLYNAFYKAFTDFKAESSTKVAGTKNILMQPDFEDINKIRNIVSKFEDSEMISSIKETDEGIKVYIGKETLFDDDVTIVKTKYNVSGKEGTLAIVGPKRMQYDRVISLLEFIKKNIER